LVFPLVGYSSLREVICATDDFLQLAPSLALLINEQVRVTDDVDEEVCAIQSQYVFSSSAFSLILSNAQRRTRNAELKRTEIRDEKQRAEIRGSRRR